jgi:hypothetical protein
MEVFHDKVHDYEVRFPTMLRCLSGHPFMYVCVDVTKRANKS